jgi:three-Cys-motif partner protein
MKKGHKENTVGPWAIRKLDALEAYLKFYTLALSKQHFTRIYIDAFAGSCISKLRSKDAIIEASPFFGEQDDTEAHDQFISGSPIRALNVEHGFHRHYFFDLDESRAQTLRQLDETFASKVIKVEVGDSNPLIRDLAKTLHAPNVRGVAFLDPYGPHLEWATVEALAATKNFEVIINFPAAMAINRLITRSGSVPEKWSDMLTRCFGTDDWRKIAYQKNSDLFGQEVTTKQSGVAERLLDLYMGRLKDIFLYVATPRLIRNTRKSPLYYLIWAGPNKLGLKGADHILSQGEKVKPIR